MTPLVCKTALSCDTVKLWCLGQSEFLKWVPRQVKINPKKTKLTVQERQLKRPVAHGWGWPASCRADDHGSRPSRGAAATARGRAALRARSSWAGAPSSSSSWPAGSSSGSALSAAASRSLNWAFLARICHHYSTVNIPLHSMLCRISPRILIRDVKASDAWVNQRILLHTASPPVQSGYLP